MKISINFIFAIFLVFSEKIWKYRRNMAYLVRKSVKYSFNTPKTCQNTPKIRFLHVVRIRSLFFKCANVKFDIILIQIKYIPHNFQIPCREDEELDSSSPSRYGIRDSCNIGLEVEFFRLHC